MMQDVHQLRCTGCASVIVQEALKENFRCPDCGDLYEVEYPAWSIKTAPTAAATPVKRNLPNPSALRWLWKERRTSTELKDQSGVWRFRDLLPILADETNIVSLREGNTPLYELPRSARATGTAATRSRNPR